MWAINIDWDVDIEEAFDILDEMKVEEAAEAVGLSSDKYVNMTTEEQHDYVCDYFRHRPGALCKLFDLPDKVEVPNDYDEEEISDYLSDKYGFCHWGFELKEDDENE